MKTKKPASVFLIGLVLLSFISPAQDFNSAFNQIKKAESFFDEGQYDSAYIYGKSSLDFFKRNKIDSSTGKAALIIANSLLSLSKKDSTDYTSIAEAIALKNNDLNLLIEAYFTLGNQNLIDHNDEKALKYFIKIDSISREKKISNPTTIKTVIKRAEMARTTFTKESSDYAYSLLHEALNQARKIKSEESIYFTYIYLADASGLKGEVERAKEYIDSALIYFLKNDSKKNEKNIARLYLISTGYYNATKQFDKSEESFLKGIEYTRRKGNRLELARLLNYYGNFQGGRLGRCKDAIITHEKAKTIFDSLGLNDTEDYERLNRDLADCYYEFGNHEKASKYYRIAYDLKSDLVKKRNRELSRRIETKYQTEKKEQEIVLLNTEKELIKQQKTNQRNILLGLIGLASLIGVSLFILSKNRQKTNKKLRELDQVKSDFFTNISHEFRTPLTLITGPVEQRLNSDKLSESDRHDFEMIQRNSQRLLALVNQLLDLSKLETGKYQLQVTEGNLSTLISALAESFQFTATQKGITYNIAVSGLQEVWFDKDVIEKIIVNLLSNAMKYTNAGGSVSLKASQTNNKALIVVENTAGSINPVSIRKFFDRFYQANAHEEGAGIGLSLVKELISVCRGSIKVEQTTEGMLQFEVALPIARSAYKKDEFAAVLLNNPQVVHHLPPVFSISTEQLDDIREEDERNVLLLVEDNAEVRQLLKNTFVDTYKIVEAENGHEGIKQALEYVPDLIISDIMMPGVDGLELCEKLKTDERTSHIPIILLTARAGEEDQYKGLSTGADIYITKPFNNRILNTHVSNLITSRKALRERYSQEVILKPKDIAISSLDEIFLERVQNVMNQQLTEPSFTIKEFSEAVAMSRMQLHRKLKALTGLSASEFVRSERLKLAATLLQKSDENISQIAYEVGFNDPSYFTKCFREAYGMSPKEYHKKFTS